MPKVAVVNVPAALAAAAISPSLLRHRRADSAAASGSRQRPPSVMTVQSVSRVVDDWDHGWQIEFRDRLFADPVQLLDQRAQRIAVSHDQDQLAGGYVRDDWVVPVPQHSLHDVLQAFRAWDELGGSAAYRGSFTCERGSSSAIAGGGTW